MRRVFAKVRRNTPGRMNKLEASYAAELEKRSALGVVLEYKFESLKLRLADKTYYTPDFMVVNADGELEMHEVKGFWMDDARVKIKVAAEQFPFRFKAITRGKGGWVTEDFKE